MSDRPWNYSKWSAVRDMFGAIRELMVVLAIAAFLLMPQKVQRFLHDSGVRSVAGIEFDMDKFKEAQTEIKMAQADMQEIQRQLDGARRSLPANSPRSGRAGRTFSPQLSAAAEDDWTVDVEGLAQALGAIQTQTEDAHKRLERADRMTRQALPGQPLVPPSVLFGNRSTDIQTPAQRR